MNLYLLDFNNYYNRQVKKFNTLAEYENFVVGEVDNLNFNPGDGVNTSQIVNYSGETQPDYVIVANGSVIVSRWFIIDSDFIRNGQYNLSLHRDLIVDNYDAVINAPCYIKKAIIPDTDPAIYNKENISFNQIKTSETPLKDETGTPWIVGYLPKDTYKEDTIVASDFIDLGKADLEVDDITQWYYYQFSNLTESNISYISNLDLVYIPVIGLECHTNYPENNTAARAMMPFNQSAEFDNVDAGRWKKPGESGVGSRARGLWAYDYHDDGHLDNIANYTRPRVTGFALQKYSASTVNGWFANIANKISTKLLGATITLNRNTKTFMKEQKNIYGGFPFDNYNGKTILDKATNRLFKISVIKEKIEGTMTDDTLKGYVDTALSECALPEYTIFEKGAGTHQHEYIKGEFIYKPNSIIDCEVRYKGLKNTLKLEQQTVSIKTTVLGQNNRNHLSDAPYDMFCMPFNEDFEFHLGDAVYRNKKFAALNMAVAIGIGSGKDTEGKEIAGNVYDIQLLPYCPIRSIIKNDKINISGVPHSFITSSDETEIYSVMLWCDSSNFTFDINSRIIVNNIKESNECDMYRLCSPNYASAFEFSPAQNKGVAKFNVDATYKPFNPYIHVNPDFKGLYGADFNDNRGLILSGDFSITQLNSAWAQYELQNKNLDAQFSREISNLDTQNKYQRQSEVLNAAVGTVQGAVSGGIMGGMGKGGKAGLIGSAIGATIGGITSGFAGKKDIEIQDALRAENKSFMQDMHELQLGNIKAMPYTIAKTSAMTANNKLFPFIEYYTCTPQEKENFRKKILYTSMTVDRIGTINEFLQSEPSFIRGTLIRIENINEDFHAVNTIAEEISKGIYI